MKQRYVGLNCSKCGRWVGKDGFHDVYPDDSTGMVEIGYPLCERCLDRREPTVYDLECDIRELKKEMPDGWKERVTDLEKYVMTRMSQWRTK